MDVGVVVSGREIECVGVLFTCVGKATLTYQPKPALLWKTLLLV